LDIICNPDFFENFRLSFENAVFKITVMHVVIVTSMTGFPTGNNLTVSSNCTAG